MPEMTSPVGRWVGLGGSCSDTPTQELGCCWLPALWPEMRAPLPRPCTEARHRPWGWGAAGGPLGLSVAGKRPAGH